MRDYQLLKQIGKRVRAQREFLGLTRDELAELLGVSVNFFPISNWEKGNVFRNTN